MKIEITPILMKITFYWVRYFTQKSKKRKTKHT